MAGTLYIVATPIGHAGDLPPRALRILGSVSVIAAEDPARTQALLAPHGIGTPLTSYHNDNKEEKTPVLIRRLEEGQDVALVCDAGTPGIVDPGCFLIDQAATRGMSVTTVPGPSAVSAALSVSGFPGDAYSFLGQLPTGRSARIRLLRQWRSSSHTLVFFVSLPQLSRIFGELLATIGNRRAVLASNLTTPQEHCVRGTIKEMAHALAMKEFEGDATVVIEGARARPARRRVRTRRATRRRVS